MQQKGSGENDQDIWIDIMGLLIFKCLGERKIFHIALPSPLNSALLIFLGLLMFTMSSYATQVILEWDANAEQDLAGYVVYQGTASRDYDVSMDVGNWTSATIANLEHNETYCFAVTAYDSDGNESGYSDEVCINVESIILQSGVNQTGSVAQAQWSHYQITSTASDTELVAELSDLSNDVDLYVRQGSQPSLAEYDCRPYTGGTTSETCTMENSGATTWYISVYGYRAGSFTIKATLSAGRNPGEPCGTDNVYDCVGNCVDQATAQSWIGDGYCDDGTWGMDLRCDAFSNDGGDCGS